VSADHGIYPELFGSLNFFLGMGSLVLPLGLAAVVDATSSYGGAFYYGAIAQAVAASLLATAVIKKHRRRGDEK
jgi:hypothetical protein